MICAKCNTPNDGGDPFCFECGAPLQASDSQETKVINTPPGHHFNPTPGYTPTPPPVAGKNKTLLWAALAVVLVAVIGAGGYMVLNKTAIQETLPTGGGIYIQNSERNKVDKIPMQETNNAVQAAKDLDGNESLRTMEPNSNLIIYLDGANIALDDLRLVQLKTVIKGDGNMKHIDFDKNEKVGGKSDMKRLIVPGGLADGKYAFMIADGPINEGKHRMWAFQVKNSSKSSNEDNEATWTLPIKSTPTPAPAPVKVIQVPAPNPQPLNTERARTTDGIKIRNTPTQYQENVVGSIKAGQMVYIYEYSSNYEEYKGKRANFARVQSANGGPMGWVFAYYLQKQ